MIQDILCQNGITMYQLAKDSGVPYSSVNDICNGKTRLEKCGADTVYRLSKTLGVTMETLLEPYMRERISFDLFKSNVCHNLKVLGDVRFLIQELESDNIRNYYDLGWYPESLYLLAMVDYLSRINGIPLCNKYDDLRRFKLEKTIYPSSISAMAAASGDDQIREEARAAAIPEFIRFNIVESEVRNVI